MRERGKRMSPHVRMSELVIARCEEDIAWIRNAAPGIRATVYNKGPALDFGALRDQ